MGSHSKVQRVVYQVEPPNRGAATTVGLVTRKGRRVLVHDFGTGALLLDADVDDVTIQDA